MLLYKFEGPERQLVWFLIFILIDKDVIVGVRYNSFNSLSRFIFLSTFLRNKVGLKCNSIFECTKENDWIIIEPPHDKSTKWHVRPTKTDQPGHPPSLIRLFAVRSMGI